MAIQWPKRYVKFYKSISYHADIITTGTLLAIDPSSGGGSNPGYAIFKQGKLIEKGEIKIPSKLKIDIRLRLLYAKLSKLCEDPPDVLAIEEIRGTMSHVFLLWAVGVTLSAISCAVFFEVPINVWKALVKAGEIPGYEKDNDADAEAIGLALITRARECR